MHQMSHYSAYSQVWSIIFSQNYVAGSGKREKDDMGA